MPKPGLFNPGFTVGVKRAYIFVVNNPTLILKEYRNLGLGSKLINVIIDWCKEQTSIYWIDLGVFSGNDVAKLVFEKNGFKDIGYKEDAWLVDGNSIGETLMTIPVNT